jgi:hypothetical protein
MTLATAPPPQGSPPQPPPTVVGTSPWFAAVAVVPILATVYQTLVEERSHGPFRHRW